MVNLTLIMAYIVRIGVSLMINIKDECKKTIRFLISSECGWTFVVDAPGDTPLYVLLKLCDIFSSCFLEWYYILPFPACGHYFNYSAPEIIIGDDFIKFAKDCFEAKGFLLKEFYIYDKEDTDFFYLDFRSMGLK